MSDNNCLNCEKILIDKYCAGCGQKADTHRISFKNFIFHDILHGTFHIEKGMFFTAKQALQCPGKAALEYISGKRKRYYNVFYLILLTLGLILFIQHFNEQLEISLGGKLIEKKAYINEGSKKLDELFSQRSKIIIFLFVPFAAFNSFILFRRKKLNLAEHFIIAGMILLGMLLISALGNLFFYLDFIIPFNDLFAQVMSMTVTVLIIFDIAYGYFNAFAEDYSTPGILYRIVLFFAMMSVQILMLLFIVIGLITHWKFGEISVSPFG